jgi:hypothetical protein
VGAKLPAEMPFCLHGPGKNHQPTGFLVQAMDGAHLRSPTSMPFRQKVWQKIRQGFWQEPTTARPKFRCLVRMAHGSQTRRFFDHHDLIVGIVDDNTMLCSVSLGRALAFQISNLKVLAALEPGKRI